MAEKHKDMPDGGGQEQDALPGWLNLRTLAVHCIPFALGLLLALVFGWGIYPVLLFGEQEQPVAFNHQTHLLKAGMACADCHTLRDDGSFKGLPATADCAVCHASPQGNSDAEKRFVRDYVEKGRELKWLVHQKQPANVYFSHAAHSVDSCNACHDFAPRETCELCHVQVSRTEKSPPVSENRITGYGRNTMAMDQCERCHAQPDHLHTSNASNACFVCHK
jgi:hypothetical protein